MGEGAGCHTYKGIVRLKINGAGVTGVGGAEMSHLQIYYKKGVTKAGVEGGACRDVTPTNVLYN